MIFSHSICHKLFRRKSVNCGKMPMPGNALMGAAQIITIFFPRRTTEGRKKLGNINHLHKEGPQFSQIGVTGNLRVELKVSKLETKKDNYTQGVSKK